MFLNHALISNLIDAAALLRAQVYQDVRDHTSDSCMSNIFHVSFKTSLRQKLAHLYGRCSVPIEGCLQHFVA